MLMNFGDRLWGAVRNKGAPVCVGLDLLPEWLPPDVREKHGLSCSKDRDRTTVTAGAAAISRALESFGREVIRIVCDSVPAIKINIAFFEPYFADGIRTYGRLVRYAQDMGLIVIGDVKRADIGHTSAQYARAQLGPIEDETLVDLATPDAVTVNPYFGADSILPFIDVARDNGRGVFVLVQTSNASAAQVQGLVLPDGRTVGERVAQLVHEWAAEEGLVGAEGYSCVGAVVSPRDLASTRRIRELMPNCFFLVPGFGAQGRTAEEVALCFRCDGTGAVVNASRSVIYSFNDVGYRAKFGGDWRTCIDQASRDFVAAVNAAVRC